MRDRNATSVLLDADGVPLSLYDVVEILNSTPTSFEGTVDLKAVDAGTKGTIIDIYATPPGAEVDCDLGGYKFTFASVAGANLRLVQRGGKS